MARRGEGRNSGILMRLRIRGARPGDGEAVHPPMFRRHGDGFVDHWLDDGEVRWRDVAVGRFPLPPTACRIGSNRWREGPERAVPRIHQSGCGDVRAGIG